MSGDELLLAPLHDLKREATRIAELDPDCKFYLFGSAVTDPRACADYDVLVVATTHEKRMMVLDEMAGVCGTWPIDLVVFSPDEEAECDFIRAQACQPLDTNYRI
ncbi:hypothetical protein [Ensifer adhaerens]